MSPRIYDLHHYDKYFRLRFPIMLWVIAAWVAMPGLMFSVDFRTALGHWSKVWTDFWLFPGALVTYFVFWIYGQRTPTANAFWRKAWTFGRQILIIGLTMGAVVLLIRHHEVLAHTSNKLFVPLTVTLTIQFLLIAYCMRSRYLRDLFADFPEPGDLERKRVLPLVKSKLVSPGEPDYQEALKHLKANRPDEALISLRDAVTKDPDHMLAWLVSGRVMEWMGHKQEAMQAYQVAKGISDTLQKAAGEQPAKH